MVVQYLPNLVNFDSVLSPLESSLRNISLYIFIGFFSIISHRIFINFTDYNFYRKLD